jgi:hypothetical protein
VAHGFRNTAIARGVQRIPGLRQVPVAWLLVAGEVVLLARDHIERLEPRERRRVVELLRKGRGRPGNLTQRERDELTKLVMKAEPRLFAGLVAQKLAPVPLPKRMVRGRRAP